MAYQSIIHVFLKATCVIYTCLLFSYSESAGIRAWRRRAFCGNESRTAFTSIGCPCKLEGQRCRDPYSFCVKQICKCLFHIELSVSSATIPCTLPFYDDIGMGLKVTCGRLPLVACSLRVGYANGTNPEDRIGGPGDTYDSRDYGPCPFSDIPGNTDEQNDDTTKTCDQDNSLNLKFDNVLTVNYVNVDLAVNQIYLDPQVLLFQPPEPKPYLFVPSPDNIGEVINQYYNLQCVDSLGQKSNTANFQIVFPFCP